MASSAEILALDSYCGDKNRKREPRWRLVPVLFEVHSDECVKRKHCLLLSACGTADRQLSLVLVPGANNITMGCPIRIKNI